MKKLTNDLKKKLRKEKTPQTPISAEDLLSTGATQLDLACSGKLSGGFPKGKYVLLVGDSESGKTWFSMSCLAEACHNPYFNNYRLVHIDSEDGASMDKAEYFGRALERRLEIVDPPPTTVEEFYDLMDDLQKDGRPFIAVLDSENALSAQADLAKIEKQKKARRENEKEAGNYGTEKARVHSQRLRVIRNRLRKTKSILIIISQTRQNIGFGSMFEPKSRSGGTALKFFADLELWTSVVKKLKSPKIRGKEHEIGMTTKIKIKKNRITGKKPSVEVDFYHNTGIDDTGSMVKYLTMNEQWKTIKGVIDAKDLGVKLPFEKLVNWIEATDNEPKLRKLVREVWKDIESRTAVKRKRRYA